MTQISQLATPEFPARQLVTLRRAPYPYKAILAISNDVDSMTMVNFRDLHKYMNTYSETKFGSGLGLDIADSFWVFSPPSQQDSYVAMARGCSLTSETPNGAEVAKYIHSGWIDTLHSLGDFTKAYQKTEQCTRAHGECAVELFRRWSIQVNVWVNHGNANNVQNIGPKNWMLGGKKGSSCDLTDLLTELGIRYVNSAGVSALIDSRIAPQQSGAGQWNFSRYFTEDNRDGTTVYLWFPNMLDRQLSEEMLRKVAETGAFCIVAQHFGTGFAAGAEFPSSAIAALARLAEYQNRGEILVARTSRLLEYARQRAVLDYVVEQTESQMAVDIRPIRQPASGDELATLDRLRGITFQVPAGARVALSLGGKRIPEAEVRRDTNGSSDFVGIAWHRPDVTDYTRLH